MRLMVTLVTGFDRYSFPQLALEYEIPFVHQRIVEIRLHAAHGNARVCCERAAWISTRETARHEIAIQALRLAYAYIAAVALVARKVDGFIERHAFATVGAAALVLFTAVEDAVSNPKHGLVHQPICQADAWSEIQLIPRNHIVRNLAAINRHGREEGREVRRQRLVAVTALRDVEGVILQVEVRLPAPLLADGRIQLIADADIHRQFRVYFPIVLRVSRVGNLLRRNKVRGRNGAAVHYA